MVEQIVAFLERPAGMISLVGVAVIAVGFLLAAGRCAAGYRRLGPEASFDRFKVGLGRALLLGLEILVVSDVIETITVKPSLRGWAASE